MGELALKYRAACPQVLSPLEPCIGQQQIHIILSRRFESMANQLPKELTRQQLRSTVWAEYLDARPRGAA